MHVAQVQLLISDKIVIIIIIIIIILIILIIIIILYYCSTVLTPFPYPWLHNLTME